MIVERPVVERRVLDSVEAGRIPVLLGPCGSGRTSLLTRLARLAGPGRSQFINLRAAATTPERCLTAVLLACPFAGRDGSRPAAPESPRAAFDALMSFLHTAVDAAGRAPTFLIDEFLDLRTFESFPGLRHVQREFVDGLAASPNRFVLASRFTSRVHRLLRDAPARFEVVHLPPLDASETRQLAAARSDGDEAWARQVAPAVAALSAGRPAYAAALLDALVAMGSPRDPIAALVASAGPSGPLTALCRESYEFRLHRARGYGALKAILGVLGDEEPLNLTEIAQRLRRTPGSTKDYLGWLEDVDLVTSHRKRYSYEDPLLRLHVRLHGRAVPPTDLDVVREVHDYAAARLSQTAEPAAELPIAVAASPVATTEPALAGTERGASGIIEID